MATQMPAPEAVAFMKQSFKCPEVEALRTTDADFAADYDAMLHGFAGNIKIQPGGFKATSGITLPYYLNLSTNFMDPAVAPRIIRAVRKVLLHLHAQVGAPDERVAVVGMEVAGGMMVAQFAALADPELCSKFDFIYMRKARKATGTAQQLEGPSRFTQRTSASAVMQAVWIDDVNSTGSSLVDGIATLREDYNMDVRMALYIVDRSADRQTIVDPARMKLAQPRFTDGVTSVRALMDLSEIDALIPAV